MNNVALLTSREVSERLGLDVRTVHRMVQRGELKPALQVPGYRGAMLFEPDDVAALAVERAS